MDNNFHLNRFNLKNKTALITGAAGLLGVEHTAALLECGAQVIMTDISYEALVKSKEIIKEEFSNPDILLFQMDVTKKASIQNVFDNLLSKKINIDILVNNAAIDPKVKDDGEIVETSRLENFNLDDWNLQIAVGLTGAYLSSQIFGPPMAKRNAGVILNIASDLSVFSPDQRLYKKEGLPEDMQPVKPVTYSVIKSGLIGLTRYLSTYWSEKGVRCNALSPGGVFNGQNNEFVIKLSNLIPLGKMAEPDDYRAVVQFLCSDASKYMNGQNIVVDGGRSVW